MATYPLRRALRQHILVTRDALRVFGAETRLAQQQLVEGGPAEAALVALRGEAVVTEHQQKPMIQTVEQKYANEGPK